nr:RNA methyltransferase [Lysinibacillus timonensis]
MTNNHSNTFIYTFVHHIDEFDICRMEMRAFFGFDTKANYLLSNIRIDPSRSPFIQDRLEILFEGSSIPDIIQFAKTFVLESTTYKVICLNKIDIGETKKIHHPERRQLEREIGLVIEGEPDLDQPDVIFGLMLLNGRWYFGKYEKSESVWRKHIHKPNSYSTALNTRIARAVANIAVPNPSNKRAIDPLCGIGTVLIEALSMGINIVGRDINPLVCVGSRENIAHFGYHTIVTKGPISEVSDSYDAAIIDLPYNLATHISHDEQYDIIQHARRIAKRVVVVTIETIDDMVHEAGFTIVDRCEAKKHLFVRQILLCE